MLHNEQCTYEGKFYSMYMRKELNSKILYWDHILHLYIQQQQRLLGLDHMNCHAFSEQIVAKLEFGELLQFAPTNYFDALEFWIKSICVKISKKDQQGTGRTMKKKMYHPSSLNAPSALKLKLSFSCTTYKTSSSTAPPVETTKLWSILLDKKIIKQMNSGYF